MTEKERQIESIFVVMDTVHSIRCSNCKRIAKEYNCSEEHASEQFYNDGWRFKKQGHIYCPKCVEVMEHNNGLKI